jgi:predicted nucleic acid-binding protein
MAIGRDALIVDTGFWFALFDPGETKWHPIARKKANHVESLKLIIPWPLMYETLNTRFVKNRWGMEAFERRLKKPDVEYIEDGGYREKAFAEVLEAARIAKRPIAFCDMIIRHIMSDVTSGWTRC